jgi:hypothetical protein
MANRGLDLWARILAASVVVLLVGAPALTAAASADNNNNFSAHLQGKAGSSPVYLADKNDKSGGGGGGDHGKSGDNKHSGSSSGSGSSSDEGDTSNDTTTSNNSSSSSNSGSDGAADSHEDEGTTDTAEDNSTSQVTPVAQKAQQNDEQPQSPPENQTYPEDTYPDSYFYGNPLKKMELQRYLILDQEGNAVSSAKPGDSIKIAASYKNLQQKEQRYALITQIIDQNGITVDVSWSIDTIEGGGYADWSKLWKPDSPAEYTIKTIVWSGVGENPMPLSDINVMAVMVQ